MPNSPSAKSKLPVGVSVVEGPSFVPACDHCGWIGRDCWTRADAEREATKHVRSYEHGVPRPVRIAPVGQSENLNILPGGYFARLLEKP